MSIATVTEKVRWDAVEIDRLARAWVDARKASPFAPTMSLFEEAQRKALPDDRHRNIASITNVPALEARIATLWTEQMAKQEPQFVHIVTAAAPNYVEMLNNLDTASIMAVLFTRVGKELEAFKPLLAALGAAKELNGHTGAPLNPPVSLLARASSKPRRARVLVVGPLKDQFVEIERRVITEHIPVELLWLDKDKSGSQCPSVDTDFAVCTRFVNHSHTENIKRAMPPGRFFYLAGESGITGVVNKVRDIGSMLPPLA